MDYRQLIDWCTETPNASDIVHEIVRETKKLTVRGRVPTEKEREALALLMEARAAADAQEATAAAQDGYAIEKRERHERDGIREAVLEARLRRSSGGRSVLSEAKRLDNAAAPAS
jgi:hypothetical protein